MTEQQILSREHSLITQLGKDMRRLKNAGVLLPEIESKVNSLIHQRHRLNALRKREREAI